jgi:hypothetical protein
MPLGSPAFAPIAVFGAIASLTCALGGCYGFLPEPAHADRVRAATEQEKKRCDAQPQPALPELFAPETVESVAPLYYYVPSGTSATPASTARRSTFARSPG